VVLKKRSEVVNNRNEVSVERAREKEMDSYFESFHEDDYFKFDCIYCGEKEFELVDMADVLADEEKGICSECAQNEAYAGDWGLE
jgi:hypothetical protein